MPSLQQCTPAASIPTNAGQSCGIRLPGIWQDCGVKTWSMVLIKSWPDPRKTLDIDDQGLESVQLWVGARCASQNQHLGRDARPCPQLGIWGSGPGRLQDHCPGLKVQGQASRGSAKGGVCGTRGGSGEEDQQPMSFPSTWNFCLSVVI